MKVSEWKMHGDTGRAKTFDVEKELLEKSLKMFGYLIDGDTTNYDDMYLKLSVLDKEKIRGVYQEAIYQMNLKSWIFKK